MKNIIIFIFATVLLSANAQKVKKWDIPPQSDTQLLTVEEQKSFLATDEDMKWFEDAKFGIFIHWGPATLVTTTLSWGRYGERPGAGKPATGGVPPEIYDSAYKRFNPVDFNADRWVKQMQSWGAKYFTFVTKHHDGFCMFDAPNTDYDIMNTPFKRDIAKELADAAHKYGMKIFWYYSQPDWHHPDCLRKDTHYDVYLPYMYEQIRWLLTKYGKIDGIFFDGLGSKYWHWDIKKLIPMIKELQPGILINPRYGFGLPDMTIRGDYDTPEQQVGPINHYRYWESCITVTGKWLYDPKGPVKTTGHMISLLVQVVGNGGNLLLNFGPDSKGDFVKEEAQQAEGLGKWLEKYGESIYGTRRGIYISGDWGTSTQKDNKLYLHFLERFAKGANAEITLPELPAEIVSSKGIAGGFKTVEVTGKGLKFIFDKKLYEKNVDNIVELTLSSTLEGRDRIPTWLEKPLAIDDFRVEASSEQSEKRSAISIFKDKRDVFSEGAHIKNWWQPQQGDKNPYISVILNSPQPVKTVYISEQIRSFSVKDFSIEILDTGDNWNEVYRGNSIGSGFRLALSGESVKGIKLKIFDASKVIKISTFNLYK